MNVPNKVTGECATTALEPESDPLANEEIQDAPQSGDTETIARIAASFGAPAMAGGVALAALLANSGCAPGPPPPPIDPFPDQAPVMLTPELRRLVERMTFGLNAREAQLANQLGAAGYLEYHLAYESIDDSALQRFLSGLPTLGFTPKQRAEQIFSDNYTSVEEFLHATFVRSAYSTRQLYERMVEFWSNHFNILFDKDGEEFLKPVDDQEVVRGHALGTFPEILSASAHSPAMLLYLDGLGSMSEAPIQNYPRELMELHTIGPDNFTQQDVEEVSRCFTGWSANFDESSPGLGRFLFRPEWHDNGAKTVLGKPIPAGGGQRDAEIVLEILSLDPDIAPLTAQLVGRKIAIQFWAYDPPQGLVDDIAAAYLATGGDIRSMIRAALAPDWLATAQPKLKRPYHYAMSALRARPSSIANAEVFSYLLRLLANHPFLWHKPDGYPDSLEYWGGFLLTRWSYAAFLTIEDPSKLYDLTPFLEPVSVDEFLVRVNAWFFNGAMPPETEAELRAYVELDLDNLFRRLEAVSLAIGSPEFQWY